MRDDLRTRRWAVLLAGTVALYGAFIVRSAFEIDGALAFSLRDDAMVSMRYARNLAAGHGLTWNPGLEPVEGYTNLLWTLWMALVHLAGLPDRLTSLPVMVGGAALLAVNVALVAAVARRAAPGSTLAPGIAAVLTALYYPLVLWTLRGLEVGLVAALMSASVLLALGLGGSEVGAGARRDNRLLGLGLVLAAGLLTRDDFAVFAGLVGIVVCAGARGARARVGVALLLGVLPALAVAGHEAYRLAYYGELLPNTYHLKLAGTSLEARLERGVAAITASALTQLWAPAVLAVAALWSRHRLAPAARWLLLGPLAAQCAYSVWVGGDTFEVGVANRFISPAMPLALVAAAVTLEDAAEPGSRRVLAACAAALGAGALLGAWTLAGDPVSTSLEAWLGAPVRSSVAQVAGLSALALLCAWAVTKRSRPPPARPLALAAAVLLGAALVGEQLYGWAARGFEHHHLDRRLALYGVVLRQTTSPSARVALTAAGAPAYFSRREAVDVLGKADRVIARGRPRSSLYWPGHTKWDLRHSVGRLRPDVVGGVWGLSAADERLLERLGYVRLAGGADLRVIGALYMRRDTREVNIAALDRRVGELFPAR